MKCRGVSLLLLAGLLGCSAEIPLGSLSPDAEPGDSNTTNQSTTDSATPSASTERLNAAALCAAQPTILSNASSRTIPSLLSGAWILCSGPLDDPVDQAGIEFTLDYRFYVLRKDADSRLVRGIGPLYAGTYSVIDTSMINGPQSFVLFLNYNSGKQRIVEPFAYDAPSALRLVDSHLGDFAYARGDLNAILYTDYSNIGDAQVDVTSIPDGGLFEGGPYDANLPDGWTDAAFLDGAMLDGYFDAPAE